MKKINYLIITIGLFSLKAFSQHVAIELEKMNVLYISIDNPIKVIAQDYPCNMLVLKSKYGVIKPAINSCHYIYRTDSCNENSENIFVGVMLANTVKWLDTLEYRMKKIPDPTVIIANIFCSYIDRNLFLKAGFLRAELLNMDFSLSYSIIQYSVDILRNDTVIYKEVGIAGNKFSSGLITEIEKSKTGDKYVFYDVEIKSNDICSWKLPGTYYIIE